MSVGALIVAIVVFHAIMLIAAQVLGPLDAAAASMSVEALKERAFALTGSAGIADDGVAIDLNDQVRLLHKLLVCLSMLALNGHACPPC